MENLVIQNSPIDLLLKAFTELWPDVDVEIYIDPNLPQPTTEDFDDRDFDVIDNNDIVEIGAAGATRFEEGKIPLILLNPDQPFMQFVQTLAEELAHVSAGYKAGHGPEFNDAMELLQSRYEEMVRAKEASHEA